MSEPNDRDLAEGHDLIEVELEPAADGTLRVLFRAYVPKGTKIDAVDALAMGWFSWKVLER